jgi:hypothetical protein
VLLSSRCANSSSRLMKVGQELTRVGARSQPIWRPSAGTQSDFKQPPIPSSVARCLSLQEPRAKAAPQSTASRLQVGLAGASFGGSETQCNQLGKLANSKASQRDSCKTTPISHQLPQMVRGASQNRAPVTSNALSTRPLIPKQNFANQPQDSGVPIANHFNWRANPGPGRRTEV